MTKIAIVYHSGYGHTEKQAKHVKIGAELVSNVSAQMFKVEENINNVEKLNSYDALIFGTPTYMGSVSAQFKTFMEASSKLWINRSWVNKISAGFTNSHSMSGDKLNTLFQLTIFAMQHGMIWVGNSEMNQSPEGFSGKAESINRIGSFLGAMAQSDNFSPDITPPVGDLKTAELLGKRVAEITKRFKLNS